MEDIGLIAEGTESQRFIEGVNNCLFVVYPLL